MEQLADVVPMVQILDFPVPQMVEQLVDVFRFFDTLCPVPEQVIEVPKFVCPPRAARTVLCAPQLAEQLVEVPTLISFSSFQRTLEQHVDIPVPRRGGRHVGLQGFLPEQSSTVMSSSLKRISERTVEQIVDIPSGVGLGQGSSSSAGPAEEDFTVVFHTFPMEKVRSARQVSADLPRHVSSWTPAAYDQSHEKEKEKEKEEAEYERRMQVLNRRVRDDIPLSPAEYEAWHRWSGLPPLSSSSSGRKRKKKKRRKRRTRRTCTSTSTSSVSRRTQWRSTCLFQLLFWMSLPILSSGWLVLLVTVHLA